MGHRGFPARFPDNTLAGFLAASNVAEAVETDVRRCGDGKLVLAHDPWLADRPVATTPFSLLGDLDLGGGHHPALLDEVMSALPGTTIQIEVKNLPFEPGYEPDHRVALEAAERARGGDVVTSFNPETIAAVRRVFPKVTTGLCVPGSVDLGGAIRLCLDRGHQVVVPSVDFDAEDLAKAVDAGLLVYPWVTESAPLVKELVAVGVTGIITDDPAAVREMLGGS